LPYQIAPMGGRPRVAFQGLSCRSGIEITAGGRFSRFTGGSLLMSGSES